MKFLFVVAVFVLDIPSFILSANIANRDYDCDAFHPRRFPAPFLFERAVIGAVSSICEKNRSVDYAVPAMFSRSVQRVLVTKLPTDVFNPIANVQFVGARRLGVSVPRRLSAHADESTRRRRHCRSASLDDQGAAQRESLEERRLEAELYVRANLARLAALV